MLIDSKSLVGKRIKFKYNGKVRYGMIERVSRSFFTLKHDKPEDFGGKVYSNYSLNRIGGSISLV